MTGSRAREGSPGTRRATWLRGLTPHHGCTTVLPCRIERGERGAQGQFFPFPFIFMDEPSLMRVTENEGMECLNHTEWGCPAGVGACGGGDRASWSHRARTPPRGAGLRRQAPTPAGCFSSGSVCGDPAPSPLRVAGLAAPASGCGVAVPDTRPRPPFASAAVLTAEPRAADPPFVLPPKVRVKAKQRATGTLRRLRTSSAARGTDAEKKPGEARLSPRRPARAWRRRLEFARKGSSLSKRRTPCRVTCAEAMVSPTLPSGTGSKARSGSLPAAGDARCPPPPPPRPLGHAAATVLGTKPSGSHTGQVVHQEVDSEPRAESASLRTKRHARPAREHRGSSEVPCVTAAGPEVWRCLAGLTGAPRERRQTDSSRRCVTPGDKGAFRGRGVWGSRLDRTWLRGVAGPRAAHTFSGSVRKEGGRNVTAERENPRAGRKALSPFLVFRPAATCSRFRMPCAGRGPRHASRAKSA